MLETSKRTAKSSPAACGLCTQSGMHARPAVKLTKLAKKFQAQISIRASDAAEWINAKSVAKVMAHARGARQHHRDQGVRRGRRGCRGGIGRPRRHRFSGYRSVNNASGHRRARHTEAEPRRSVLRTGRSCASIARRTAARAPARRRRRRGRFARRSLGGAADRDAGQRGRRGSRADPRISGGVAGRRGLPRSDLCGDSPRGRRRIRPGRPRSTSRSRIYNSRARRISAGALLRSRGSARSRAASAARRRQTKSLRIPGGAVVCADDLPPSRFLEIDWSGGGGLALLRGSPTSHVAMLARARGIPMVVQLGSVSRARSDRTARRRRRDARTRSDLGAGRRCSNGGAASHRRAAPPRAPFCAGRPPSWRGEKIRLLINIQRVEDLDHADAQYADGIGLMRTEFLLGGRGGIARRGDAIPAYDAVLRWAGNGR